MGFEDKKGGKEQIVDMTEAIADWEQRLAAAEPEDFNALANQAVTKLDELLPYKGEVCVFSGQGQRWVFDEELRPVLVREWIHAEGTSWGFDALPPQDGERPTLHYAFVMPPLIHKLNSANHVKIDPNIAFTEVKSTSAVPVSDFEAAFERTDEYPPAESIATLLDDMQQTATILQGLYRSPQFRNDSLRRQQEIIDKVVESLDHRYAGLRGMRMAIRTSCGMKPALKQSAKGGKVSQDIIPFAENELEATFLGFNNIERERLTYSPIRRDRDIVDYAVGLCMMMAVSAENEVPGLKPDEVIMVPVENQTLGITFQRD